MNENQQMQALKWYLSPAGGTPVSAKSPESERSFYIAQDRFDEIADPVRLAFLEEKVSRYGMREQQLSSELNALSPGKKTVALISPVEEDASFLLEHGQLWGKTHKVMKGAPSSCHSNSCYLFEANQEKDIYVATGYALSEDGLWRQHSWCVLKKARSVQMIETTVPRVAYFGIVLGLEKLKEFAINNTDLGIEVHQSTMERFGAAYALGADRKKKMERQMKKQSGLKM